jgi:hypothetical protein
MDTSVMLRELLLQTFGAICPIHFATILQYSNSEWKEKWRKEAIDFLLEQHSLETRRALD